MKPTKQRQTIICEDAEDRLESHLIRMEIETYNNINRNNRTD